MKIVGIRDLKDRLSEYLRHVRRKGPVYVSNRGEIVAELRTSYGPGSRVGRSMPEGLRELSDRGALRVGAANDPALYPVLDGVLKRSTAQTLLDEERGVTIYAEPSAVLSWLLGEADGTKVAGSLAAADEVIASDLTLVECDRVLVRGVATGVLTEADAAERRHVLARAAAHWHVLHLAEDAVDRARRPFPAEPIRTLDALHLSLALTARAVLPDLKVLSLDHRVRENALALGLTVEPDED